MSKGLLVVSGVIAAVASAALLVPALAFGQPVLPLAPAVTMTDADDGPGNGGGKAWGDRKDSDDFPGHGRGLDKDVDESRGQGNAWGHHKDSDNFPGKGRGLEKNKGDD